VTGARPLRVLLVANDGFSAGHVARAIAIARGLARVATRRGISLGAVLATTSQAHALLAPEPLAIVTLPAPTAARRAGLSDAERRRLVRAALDGVVEGFAPDLIVVDTFPSGPHGEIAGLGDPAGLAPRAKRALVRRSVPELREDALLAGLGDYDLAVLAGDPAPQDAVLPIPTLRVPPITLAEARDGLDREAARASLALPDGRAILVAAGGGGDPDAAARALAIAEAIVRVAPEVTPVLALGPLAPDRATAPGAKIRVIRIAPLAPVLAAFDGAFAPAGYNTAHELAKARVPAALFAQPRPFDDQADRAARFASAGFACALASATDDAIARALAWMATARVPELEAGGADRAAEGLIDLVTGRAPGRATEGRPR
jgi:UDP-N-acetylglucosamine--N-acetylmuramyl-(pentapeptide) pyrophosphoryl-undecaprenol N-acetylglucosamine transferase